MLIAETAPETEISHANPTAQTERIVIVDILRGFALFGVLQGNFSAMVNNKKEADNPLLELLNPVRESNYILHQLLKKKK